MVKQIKNLVEEPLQRRTAPFASGPVYQEPVEDAPIGGGAGFTTPILEPAPPAPEFPGNSDGHRQDIFNRNK